MVAVGVKESSENERGVGVNTFGSRRRDEDSLG